MTDDRIADDLSLTIHRVSSEAFTLAKQMVDGVEDRAALQQQAGGINARLKELWPVVDAAPTAVRADLTNAWSNARADVDYVLSGGTLPTSTRLHHYMREAKPT